MSNITSHFLHTLPIPPSNWEVLGHLQEDIPLQLSKSPPLLQRVILGIAVCESPPIPKGPGLRLGQRVKWDSWELSDLRTSLSLSPKSRCPHCHWTKQMTNHFTQRWLNVHFLLILIIQTSCPFDKCVCLHFSHWLSHHIHLKGIIICPLKYPR